MAYFGTALPTFTADGTNYTLPTPANRYEWTEKICKEYENINYDLLVVDIGYRLVLRLEFVDLEQSDFEKIISITEATNVSVTLGGLPISFPVKVTRIEGEMANVTTNELILEVKRIKLFKSIPNADLYYTIRKIFNGAIYHPKQLSQIGA